MSRAADPDVGESAGIMSNEGLGGSVLLTALKVGARDTRGLRAADSRPRPNRRFLNMKVFNPT